MIVRDQDRYGSRLADSAEVVSRPDPVVWGGDLGPLSDHAVRRFDEEGFLFFPGMLDEEETRRIRSAAERLASEADRDREEVITEPDGPQIRSVFRVHRGLGELSELCWDPRLLDIARQLLGGDVEIFQSRINYKPALDGRKFYWHSDFETWHMEDGMPRPRALSVSVLLTDNDEANGPLLVIPGSHRLYVRCAGETPEDHYKKSLKKQEYGVPNRSSLQTLLERCGSIRAITGKAGSVLFFDCNLMHASPGNLSPYPRSNLFFVLNSAENELTAPFAGTRPRPGFLAER